MYKYYSQKPKRNFNDGLCSIKPLKRDFDMPRLHVEKTVTTLHQYYLVKTASFPLTL